MPASTQSAVVAALRAESQDDVATYFGEDPTKPGDLQTERALHVRLHALHREAPPTPTAAAEATAMRLAELPQSEAAGVPAAQATELENWVSRHWDPALAPSDLVLADFPETGRGLTVQKRDLAPGEAVLTVPEQLLLTSDHALELPGVASAVERASASLEAPVHDDALLAIALLLQPVVAPDGPWAEYLPLLPARPPNALLWRPAQLGRMGGTPLPSQVLAVRRTLRHIWTTLTLELSGVRQLASNQLPASAGIEPAVCISRHRTGGPTSAGIGRKRWAASCGVYPVVNPGECPAHLDEHSAPLDESGGLHDTILRVICGRVPHGRSCRRVLSPGDGFSGPMLSLRAEARALPVAHRPCPVL